MKPTGKDIFNYFVKVVIIVISVLLIMLISDNIKYLRAYERLEAARLIPSDAVITIDNDTTLWENSIYNYENFPFIIEVAFNLEIDALDVTQDQFNDRYLSDDQ